MSQTSEIPSNVHSRNESSFSSSTVNANSPRSHSDGISATPARSEIPAVSVHNASKSFPRTDLPPVEAIADVSIDVDLGEFVVIVGPSGCGKSTLLNIIAGLAEPDIGSVSLEGDGDAERIGRVAYMHQIDLLLPWRNVLANAILGLEIAGVPRTEADIESDGTRWKVLDIAEFPKRISCDAVRWNAATRGIAPSCFARTPRVCLLDEPFQGAGRDYAGRTAAMAV